MQCTDTAASRTSSSPRPWTSTRDLVRNGVALAAAVATLVASPLAAQETPGQGPDHGTFDDLLRTHVDSQGMVDYEAFDDSEAFDAYLVELDEAELEGMGEQDRLALWINAYNAYTIELINRHEERESIRNINRALGFIKGKGPWNERLARVAGEEWTLDEIEHEIIRVRFDEPRIHFAVVCAALGCPPLRAEAYRGDRLDAQLQDQALRFLLHSPEKNRVEVEEGKVFLSPIFDWYREDFPSGDEGLGTYLATFFPPGPERAFLEGGDFDVEHTDYDWSLNARR